MMDLTTGDTTLRLGFGSVAAAAAALTLGAALVTGTDLTSAYGAPGAAGAPVLALEVVRLFGAAAALATFFELDRRLSPSQARALPLATEMGIIGAALLMAAGAVYMRLLVGPAPAGEAADLVRWTMGALAIAGLPGVGLWALICGWVGWRSRLLPRWTAAAGIALGAASAMAFIAPVLEPAFALAGAIWWAGLSLVFAGRAATAPLSRQFHIAVEERA